jgi:hypothetical protein
VSPWVIVLIVAIAVGGLVTALKGRVLWLLVGFLVGGLIWPLTAFIPAAPGSPWAVRFGRDP